MMTSDLRWNKNVSRWQLGAGGLLAAFGLLLATAAVWPSINHILSAQAPSPQNASTAQKTVWYFYRVKWGYQEEFQALFARNHLPVLREEMKAGRIVAVKTYVPTYHGDGRADWTFAVVITYKDAAELVNPFNEAEIQKRLYPDSARFQSEERRRFEIVDAHWDVPLNEIDLSR